MTRGLVIGKFYPPHKGHSYLIEYAIRHSDEVDVLICDSPRYEITAAQRKEWLQTIHPNATIHIIPDLDDDDNSEAWAQHTISFLGRAPDVVFSSEDYGIAYAKYMNARHHMVDRERLIVPTSGTRVRKNRIEEWRYIHPVVQRDVALRIVIVGAESTGTTTLAHDLATRLNVPWVPEYGRLYSEGMLPSSHEWTDEDFEHIATMQQSIENRYAEQSDGMIICDTNATATEVWQQRYMGHTTSDVHAIASQDQVDLYIITGDEIPFVQDGTRDGELIRHDMHEDFITHIQSTNVPYILVKGDPNVRLQIALETVRNLDLRDFQRFSSKRT